MKLIVLFLSCTAVSATAQPTIGYSTIGVNGGASKFAPCTEILQFDNYNDALAGGIVGQNFVFILKNGDSLFFNLKRIQAPVVADTAPTYFGAAFGQFGYSGLSGKTVLYQTEAATNTTLTFDNIYVKDKSGTPVTGYRIVVLDGEATNVGETFVTAVPAQSKLFFWDSISPPGNLSYGTPPQSGIGTNTVTWGPGLVSYDYQTAFSIASDAPSYVSVTFTHTADGLEGMAMGISDMAVTITSDKTIFCSGDSLQICAPEGFSSYQWNSGVTGTSNCIEATTAGDYYVTVTDDNGCSAESNHLPIDVYPVSSVATVIFGDTLSSYGAVTYQWLLNNNPIPKATDSVYIAPEPGLYSLQITDTNGCTVISRQFAITGITDLQKDRDIAIYPNPSLGSWQLAVSTESMGSGLQLFDEEGRIVFQSQIRSLKSEITTDELPEGVYFLRIYSTNTSIIKRVVKL